MTMPTPLPFSAILGRIPGYRHFVLKRADRLPATAASDVLLTRWVTRDPDHLALRLRHALGAHHQGCHQEALRRWDAIRAHWPDEAFAWSGSASNLRELGRSSEAKAVIDEALRRFPEDLITLSEAIRVHHNLRDVTAVLALSAEMVRVDPEQPQWRRDHFDRLLEGMHLAQASALLDGADADDPLFAVCKPLLALRRGDEAAAEAMLRAFLEAPDRGGRTQLLAAALSRKLRHPTEAYVLLTHL